MPGLPDTFAGMVLDFITNRKPYVWTPASLGTVTVAITTGVLTVSAAHGLLVNDLVKLGTMTAGAPLAAATTYYVQSVPTTTTLTLSATQGGTAIVTTSAGSSVSITPVSGNTYTGDTYLALLSIDPGDDATMLTVTEITDAGYARQLVSYLAPYQSPRGTSNSALFTYGPFSAGMASEATHAALVEASTGSTGKVRYVWSLDAALLAGVGESIQFPASILALGW